MSGALLYEPCYPPDACEPCYPPDACEYIRTVYAKKAELTVSDCSPKTSVAAFKREPAMGRKGHHRAGSTDEVTQQLPPMTAPLPMTVAPPSYTRIRGALHNLEIDIGRNSIKRILLEHGIEPAPERRKRMPWKTFLKSHFGGIAGADFLVDAYHGFLDGYRCFIVDRDPLFTAQFRDILKDSGVETLRLPARSPNLNNPALCGLHVGHQA